MKVYLMFMCRSLLVITCDASCISYESCAYITTIVESLNVELTTIIIPSHLISFHLMDVMGICYSQYWFHDDGEENFNYHLEMIKPHYGIK